MSTPTSGPGPDEPAGPPPGQGGPPSYGQGAPGYGQGAPGYGQPDPGYGQPDQGYGPPAPAYGEPAPGYGQGAPQGYGQSSSYPNAPAGFGEAPTRRPGQVTAAAIIGIVVGGLGLLGSLLTIGAYFQFAALLGLLSLVSLAVSVGLLAGGIQVLRGGAPNVLLYAAYGSIAITLVVIIYVIASGYGFSAASLVDLLIPGLIVFFIRQNGAWFARTTH
jgi:hypothetical protein